MDRRRRAECSHLRFYLVLYHLWFLLHHMMTLLAIQFRFHFFLPRQWLISFSGSYFHSAVKTDSLLRQLSWRVIMSYWGGGKKEEKRGRTRRRNARPGYFDTLHKSHPSSRFVDRNCGIIHKEKKPSTVPPTPPSIARTFLPYPHCAQRFPAIVSLLSLLSFFLPRNGTGVIGVRALAMGEGSGN